MTLAEKIAWDDTILPFQLDASDTRGRVARLDGVLDGILKQHDYPPAVEALVAEMALLTALIGQTVKQHWKLSLQVQTKGPVRMIATDYFAPTAPGEPARMRAYAGFDGERLGDGAPFDQLGEGYFAVLIDQGPGSEPYQGITPLAGGSLSACAEAYFRPVRATAHALCPEFRQVDRGRQGRTLARWRHLGAAHAQGRAGFRR